MAARITATNGRILAWARARAGFTVEEAAEAAERDPAELLSWETGEAFPTFRQLEKLSSLYKRPLAVFFFPEPPPEPDVKSEFRTLPDSELEKLGPDTRFAIRDAHAYLQSLRELTGGRNPAERLILKDIRATLADDVHTLVTAVRRYLDVSVEEQRRWTDAEAAFKNWRSAIEGVGVHVFKRSFEQAEISAFCLHDEELPLIMINNSTAFNRQTFSLFHELAHLLYGVNGITTEDAAYVYELQGTDRSIEVACNRFAAEFLVPRDSFPIARFRSREGLEDKIADVARSYNVSREVILRRLLDEGIVDQRTYLRLAAAWNDDFRRSAGSSPGGNYYLTKAAYLGDAYLQLAFEQFHSGRITLPDLAEHLQVKARNVETLESYFRRRK